MGAHAFISRNSPATTLGCDHCRGKLGLDVQRYWHMQFCSSARIAAYQQRLAPETKIKICRLDILRSENELGFCAVPLAHAEPETAPAARRCCGRSAAPKRSV